MKKMIAILMILIPLAALSQAKKSDAFYYKGFELINAKKYKEAIAHYEKCSLMDKEDYDESEGAYYYRSEEKLIECYEALAEEYSAKYNIEKALRYKSLEYNLTKQRFGENDPVFAQNLEELAYMNSFYIGNYAEAVELQSQAVKIYKKLYGDQNEDYGWALGSLAYYNYQIGNYIEAIKLENSTIKFRQKKYGDDSRENATSVDFLANCYAAIGDYETAVRLEKKALEIFRDILGEDDEDYASTLSNLANMYDTMHRIDEAIEMGTRALKIRKNLYGEKHPHYAFSLVNLAYYHYEKNNCNYAIKLVSKACKIFKNYLGVNHNYYARSLKNLAMTNFRAGNYSKAAKDFQQSYSLLRSYVLNNFSSLTYNERSMFWTMYSEFFGETLALSAYKHPSPALLSLAYNGQVFAKGLTLNAELEIQQLIENSGDKTFLDRYRKIKKDRVVLDRLFYTSPKERKINADSLAEAIEHEEKLLVEASKELGDYTRNLSVEWKDIQKQLTDNDIAIEFVDIFDDKKELYAALILKKNMKNPQIVHLFDADDIATIKKNDYYTSPALNSLIWKQLDTYLNGVENVYFSPAGMFYTTGIEYLPDENGVPFSKKYKVFRLSSTRELALNHDKKNNRKAAVYGGIFYDFDKGDWSDLQDADYKRDLDARTSFRDVAVFDDEPNTRAGVAFLRGTKVEADTITAILRQNNFQVSENCGVYATEGSFKNLSGSGINILHIATHGFYRNNRTFGNSGFGFNNQNSEDISLSRSGLLLTGANSALNPNRRDDIPDGIDDGVLTAKEISRLDFSGLDLVILSACETALGDVTDEGVFGLQRGFKKAGAQTIIMSLWEVDDYATQLLMVEFFKKLGSGLSKRDAFNAAQEYVKSKTSDPKYWAAFIIVDAL